MGGELNLSGYRVDYYGVYSLVKKNMHKKKTIIALDNEIISVKIVLPKGEFMDDVNVTFRVSRKLRDKFRKIAKKENDRTLASQLRRLMEAYVNDSDS